MKNIRRWRWSYAALAIVVLAGLLAYQAYRRPLPHLQPVATVTSSSQNIVPPPSITWSPYGQQSITVVGTKLSTNNGASGSFPMASTAKVMLALIILQKRPLAQGQQGPGIPITGDIVSQYQQELAQNESVVPVTSGETLSEYQALQAMLIPSATNIADLLAEWQFGSVSAYTAVANQEAASLGLKNTHFADASGFSPGTVSSAQDLDKLGQKALQNKVLAKIVSQQSVTLPVAGTVSNFNTALGQDGINGIKTGNTDQAGGVFLYSAPFQGHMVVGATMNASDLGTALHDAPEILQSFESNLQTDTPIKAGQIVGHYRLPWGGTVDAIAENDMSTLDWSGTKLEVHESLQNIRASTAHSASIGSLTINFEGTTQISPIVLSSNIPQPSLWWRLFH